MKIAHTRDMPLLTIPSHTTASPKRPTTKRLDRISSADTIAEINAYIAIRDELFLEAEQSKTPAKFDTVTIANDFVESCLKPAPSPYETQCLPESDAARERKRCQAVRDRIAQLRAESL
jgi:hypothetical protein